jgi:uncharacterized protein YecT (DUF1311 family)
MRLPLLLLAGLLSSSAAFAQECDRSDESPAGMNVCAHEDYEAADAKLNKTYGEIMKRLSDDAEGRKLLQAAQRAWIGFRDAECDFSTADSQGGSIHPMLMSGCLQGLTEARTKQLDGYLECEEGDMSCPVPAE